MAPHKLTDFEKRCRLTFARNNIDNQFRNVCFVDESSCWTLRSGLYHSRKPTKNRKCNGIRPRFSEKVHVWSGISWNGPLPYVVYFLKTYFN